MIYIFVNLFEYIQGKNIRSCNLKYQFRITFLKIDILQRHLETIIINFVFTTRIEYLEIKGISTVTKDFKCFTLF